MIQIYKPENTDFSKNGDMTLLPTDATVHPVLNGTWEVKLEHPIDEEGRWKYIVDEAVVKMPSFNGEQLFRIKHKEKNDSGISADLQPIFMDAKDDCFLVDVRPTEKTGQQALDIMTAPNKKYSAISDISTISTAYYETKNLIEAINGEDDNSFVNRWGGELVFDNFKAVINQRAGGDYGIEVLYGKNIKQDGISEEVEMRNVVTRIVPKAYNGHMIEGDTPYVDSPLIEKYPTIRYGVMKFEDVKMREDAQEDEEGVTICDTQEQLKTALKQKCMEQFENGLDRPEVTLSVDMIMLENTDLYADVRELTKVSLGDTVHCRNDKLDIVTDARVIELEWDCINDEIVSVVLGDYQKTYMDSVTSMINRVESAIRSDGSVVGAQVQGILDGVKAQFRAMSSAAKKQEVRAMLFEDLDPESPTYGAMCLGTMGFEIASKRTADGRDWDWSTFGTGQGFFADFITAGTMLADRIMGGTLTLGGSGNGNGVAVVLDASGNEVVRLDKDGVYAKGKYICDGTSLDLRVQICDGGVKFSTKDGANPIKINYGKYADSAGIGFYKEDGTSLFRVLDNGVYIDASQFGIYSKSLLHILTDELVINNGTGKTGKIEFSDGTSLDVKCGIITGGIAKEGVF